LQLLVFIFIAALALSFFIANMGFNLFISKLQNSYEEAKIHLNLIDKHIISSSTDPKGDITDVSAAFCKVSGYTKEELIGKNHNIMRHPDMPKSVYEKMWERLIKGKNWSGELKNKKKNGESFWLFTTISPLFNADGKMIGYKALRQDITEKKIIEKMSITDELSNVYNRRYYNTIFPEILNFYKRDNKLVCFLLIDIDHFKQYNDNYGHLAGDEVIKKFAQCLKQTLQRSDDMIFRLGGEEFGIVFIAENKQKAIEFANHIRHNIKNLKIPHEFNSASKYVTASMGLVCHYAKDIKDMDQVFHQADDLLYKSKNDGRDTINIL